MSSVSPPHSRRRVRRLAAIGTGVALLSGGAAFAYWTTTGSGTGAATSTTPGTVTVKQTSTVTAVNPGRPAQTLSGNFDNPPGQGSAYVTSVTVSIASVTKAGAAVVGCDATDYTLNNPTATVGQNIAEGTAQGSWTGPTVAFNNKATNQDPCKGATVNFAYTSN